MNFSELRSIIRDEAEKGRFTSSSILIEKIVFNLEKNILLPIVTEIGTIPEDILHDSSEEKLYSKVSDIILAKCFQELGLKASVNRERANCADIVAKSQFHNYSLVGDAKSFRLSRTAKNQKDFKVKSMIDWRGDNDYSILVCPYYQYPKSKSQIYSQALGGNITMFSWEYLSILLENNICEDERTNISNLWNISSVLSNSTIISEQDKCFLAKQDEMIRSYLNLSIDNYNNYFKKYKKDITTRGETEIKYWENKIQEISCYTKKKAIKELLASLKLNEKIFSIRKYIISLNNREL